MTMQLLLLMDLLYLVLLGAAVFFTRAGWRRVAGALAGGGAVSLAVPGLLVLAEAQGWWRCPFLDRPYALPELALEVDGSLLTSGVGTVPESPTFDLTRLRT